MKFKIICISICLMLISSISAIAETLASDNYRNIKSIGSKWQEKIINKNRETNLIEMAYTHMIGFISNYSLNGYNVTFHAEFLFINYFCPWEKDYAGFAIDKEIYFNTREYDYLFFKTRPRLRDISFYFATYYGEVEIGR